MTTVKIGRDGTVKLNGMATRWRVRRTAAGHFRVGGVAWKLTDEYCEYLDEARAYLATLTETELMP
jgi:hypothetical protein